MPVKPLNLLGEPRSVERVEENMPPPPGDSDSDSDTNSTHDSSLGHVGRDSFRSITSETLDATDEGESSPQWSQTTFDHEQHTSATNSSSGSLRMSATHFRSHSETHETIGLELSLSNVGSLSNSRKNIGSTGSRGTGGFGSRSGGGGGGGGGFGAKHRRFPSTASQKSTHSQMSAVSHESSGSPATSPLRALRSPSAATAAAAAASASARSPGRLKSPAAAVGTPRRLVSPAAAIGAKVFRKGLPTCRAADSRRHAAKSSKWDTAEFEPSDSDDGDSLLDTHARGGRFGRPRNSNRDTTPFSLSNLGLSAPHGSSGGGGTDQGGFGAGSRRRNAPLRRIMSEQHDQEEVASASPLRLTDVAAHRRRQTMNVASRRRPSHLAGLNLRTLISKPKYDSAHMWHLQDESRPSPQTQSCSNVNGFLFLDFDRTLAKEHTFKRSVKYGAKGLQELPRESIVEWFGGEQRLAMCKAYLRVLAEMDIATIIITHGMPQLVYQMMRAVGFFAGVDDEHPDGLVPETHSQDSNSGFSTAARKVRKSSGRSESKLPSPGRSLGLSLKLSPASPRIEAKHSSNTHDDDDDEHDHRQRHHKHTSSASSSASFVNAAASSCSGTSGFGGKPVKVTEQNFYGIVAVYGQSADSAEKFLKSQCINEVVLKLSGMHQVCSFVHVFMCAAGKLAAVAFFHQCSLALFDLSLCVASRA